MNAPGAARLGPMFTILVTAFLAPGFVGAAQEADATTSPETETPKWLTANSLQLMLSTSPQNYPVLPLTPNVGLNETENFRRAMGIKGNIIAVDASNYNTIRDSNQIPYLSCDTNETDSNITPDLMLNYLMGVKPRAILLYSKKSDTPWCSFQRNDGSDYSSILSMADPSDARWVLKYLTSNATSSGTMVSITGKAGMPGDDEKPSSGGGNSTVAMSVLYSVTGLITLLFLVIIATGTIRAHRHPERYGPRGGAGGRGRQSRAKGLARAVLDTIPIVKFGNNDPVKPDPEVELEAATTTPQDESNRDATQSQTAQTQPQASGAMTSSDGNDEQSTPKQQTDERSTPESSQGEAANQGCSICTEDFTVGEDVRVLPCHHQYHPACIDPWLVNVSGTCPLCRLDLQPGQEGNQSQDLPPPLSMDQDDVDTTSHSRPRLSRFLDAARFRQLPREEQIEALRQMRIQDTDNQGPTATVTGTEATSSTEVAEAPNTAVDGDERSRRARFATKLKDKFRIRTREQS